MIDATTQTAEQLLANRWLLGDLSDEPLAKKLLKLWHPDVNRHPLATDVFEHVKSQLDLVRKGEAPNVLTFRPGKAKVQHRYLIKQSFELGELYVGEKTLIWAAERQWDDLSQRAVSTIKTFKFPNSNAELSLRKKLPHEVQALTDGDRTYLVMDRDPNYVRLADLLAMGGPLDPRHVGWILNRAYNLAGFLKYSRIAHLDFSSRSFFIDPANHVGALLGGWYYTNHLGSKPNKYLAAPTGGAALANVHPRQAYLTSIRAMGREALGARTIGELKKRLDVPAPMRRWLSSATDGNVLEDEKGWKQVLKDSFGAPKFVELNVTTRDVYG